ncbi:unnamed protein product [Polarella glacialis]|uniref:Sugar phosphate transporter domain-containing protein n=1 Tax=Polarella glacialis TaxID=89957 RepID=A0A813GIS8_POLGL|nr:unnamed protein product [Polarella glacialis]
MVAGLRATGRPLRGGSAILLGCSASWALWFYRPAFTLPSPTILSTEVGSHTALLPAAPHGNLAGRHFRPAFPSDEASERQDARLTDYVSLALAAAGAATAATALRAVTAAASSEPAKKEKSFMDNFGVFIYFGLWYILNIGYNIYNKQSLIVYPFPWACALWQMAFGWCIFVPLWLLRIQKVPKLSMKQALLLSPSALAHLATHVGAVVAFAAGAVSFGHIVKASEPVVSSILNLTFLGEVCPWQVYASLLPIIGGVGLVSASELSFNWLCFGAAMGSNIGSAARAVYSKKVMKGDIGENMDDANVYAVITIMATFLLIPIAFAIEGPTAMLQGFKVALAAGGNKFLTQMMMTGLFYYLYNEVAFLALGKLDAVSHAVANTMKRVVIIITAIFVFRTPVTPLGMAGSCIAILGTLLYSLAKNKFK